MLMAPLVGRYAYSPQHAADVCSIAAVVMPDAAEFQRGHLHCVLDATVDLRLHHQICGQSKN